MTTATSTAVDISIKRLSINAFDFKKNKVNFSYKLFPIGKSSEVISDFFTKHINDTRTGKSKSCKFKDQDATVKVKIDRYYDKSTDDGFIDLASELTSNLFNIMSETSSTSSGTFFVLDILLNQSEWIFIIKLDPKDGVQIDLDGLTVKVLENVLPDSSNRVHKCALIKKEKAENEKVELFVLDKQQKEGEPAKFFLSNFLQAEELLNDAIISRSVVKFVKEKLESIVPESQHHKLISSIDREYSNGSRIELETSFHNLLDEYTDKNIPDREVSLKKLSSSYQDDYLTKHPEHYTSYTVDRKDSNAVYKDKENKILFKYDKSLGDKVVFSKDDQNYIIKISKKIDFNQVVK